MRILLDTCTFLWLMTDAPDLSGRARDVATDRGNELLLSAVSAWEIAVKHALGRLPLPEPPSRWIPDRRGRFGVGELPLEEAACLQVDRLPPLHGDPFDRMLVAQAIHHGLVLLTPDEGVRAYPVRTLW